MLAQFTSVMKRALLTAVVSIFGIMQNSFAEDKFGLTTTIFNDNSGLAVQAPMFQLAKDLSEVSIFSMHLLIDRVNIPPFRGISGAPVPTDAVTGASRPATADSGDGSFIKRRSEVLATWTYRRADFSGYYSAESDYIGRLVSVGINKDYLQKNTNFAVRLAYGSDTVKPTGRDSTLSKTSLLGNATLTQTLSKKTIMRLGLDMSYSDGFQSNPYRLVSVGGGNFPETHPQTRIRVAGFAKLNTYIKSMDAALWFDYRLYGDDWGVRSHALGVKFYQNMSKRLLMRYRYRFYTQSQAYFYQDVYSITQTPTFFTGDYKLMHFHSHIFGVKAVYHAPFLERWLRFATDPELSVKYERFFTSENFAFTTANFGANILQIGVSFGY